MEGPGCATNKTEHTTQGNKTRERIFRPEFFYFLFYRFFSQQVRVGGRYKNKNKIHSDHFPIELKLKETRNRVSFNFKSIGKSSE